MDVYDEIDLLILMHSFMFGMVSGNPKDFTYSVIVFNPAVSASSEIDIKGNGMSIVNGDTTPSTTDHTNFGTTPIGMPVNRIYTIVNIGDEDLNLTGSPFVNLMSCTGFSLTQQPTTPVVAGGTTAFTVQYNPTNTGGSDTCTVTIDNDNSNKNPYTFTIKGAEGIEQGADWLPAVYRLLL